MKLPSLEPLLLRLRPVLNGETADYNRFHAEVVDGLSDDRNDCQHPLGLILELECVLEVHAISARSHPARAGRILASWSRSSKPR